MLDIQPSELEKALQTSLTRSLVIKCPSEAIPITSVYLPYLILQMPLLEHISIKGDLMTKDLLNTVSKEMNIAYDRVIRITKREILGICSVSSFQAIV